MDGAFCSEIPPWCKGPGQNTSALSCNTRLSFVALHILTKTFSLIAWQEIYFIWLMFTRPWHRKGLKNTCNYPRQVSQPAEIYIYCNLTLDSSQICAGFKDVFRRYPRVLLGQGFIQKPTCCPDCANTPRWTKLFNGCNKSCIQRPYMNLSSTLH